jgi:hypothetical protein
MLSFYKVNIYIEFYKPKEKDIRNKYFIKKYLEQYEDIEILGIANTDEE